MVFPPWKVETGSPMPKVRAKAPQLFEQIWPSFSFNEIALLNVIETLLNIAYVYLAHVAQWPPATLIGLGAAIMTLSKTILYWAQEYYCGFCAVGHNNASDLFFLWIIPNGCVHLISCLFFSFICRSLNPHCSLWIIVPTLIIARLGKDLADSLNFAAQQSKKLKNNWVDGRVERR